jgi:hypothetical protein
MWCQTMDTFEYVLEIECDLLSHRSNKSYWWIRFSVDYKTLFEVDREQCLSIVVDEQNNNGMWEYEEEVVLHRV